MSKCSKCGIDMKDMKYCKSCGKQASFEDKKARVMESKSGKSWMKPAIIVALAVLIAVGGWMYRESKAGASMNGQLMFSPDRGGSTRAAAAAVTVENGEVRIPAAAVQDGNAHFFAYKAGGKTITFFVMRAADGSLRTAFDACVACNHAKLGYRQEGRVMVCNNCGMGFAPEDIGKQAGGCNPIPVQKTTDGQMIVLKAKDLEAGVRYF